MSHTPIKTLTLAGAALCLAASPALAQKKTLKMSTIAPGSSMYLVMTTMANVVNKNVKDLEIVVDATGAATKHMVDVGRGTIDMSMTAPVAVHFMTKGIAMYKKLKSAPKLAKNLRTAFWFPAGSYHYAVYADSGIKSLKDLKGKRAFVGPPGGGQLRTGHAFIKTVSGLSPKKDYKSVRASFAAAFQSFQDRQIDMYTVACLDPCGQFTQLAATSKIRFLGLTAEEKKRLVPTAGMKKFLSLPGRVWDKVDKGVYGKNQVNESTVHANGAILGVTMRKGLSDELVYKMMKAFWGNIGDIRKASPFMRNVTIEFATAKHNLDFHPGAIRYYKEAGVWKR